jgi:hypothetical protein
LPSRRSRSGVIVVLALLILGGGALAFWFFSRSVLIVENHLVEPVELAVPGSQRRTIDPGGEASFPIGGGSGVPVTWVLVRPTTPQGAAMGLEIAGTIATDIPRGTTRKVIDGRAFETPAFAPLISNASSGPISITVNAGLSGSRSCGCLIPPGATRSRIGYYPLYQNSSVQAENQARRAAMFGNLGPDVDQGNGTVGLRFEDKDFR